VFDVPSGSGRARSRAPGRPDEGSPRGRGGANWRGSGALTSRVRAGRRWLIAWPGSTRPSRATCRPSMLWLREAGTLSGRDLECGVGGSASATALLAGAIVYLVLVEQIGKSLRVRTILRRVVAFDDAASEFRGLHTSGCFVMPNPFDAGSARALEQLGFKALATTSAGLAWTLGRADNEVTLDESLEHLRVVAGAVKVPVNADFEGWLRHRSRARGRQREARCCHGYCGTLHRRLHGRRTWSPPRIRSGGRARSGGGSGSATHQRRGHAGAHRMGRVPRCRAGTRGRRNVLSVRGIAGSRSSVPGAPELAVLPPPRHGGQMGL